LQKKVKSEYDTNDLGSRHWTTRSWQVTIWTEDWL